MLLTVGVGSSLFHMTLKYESIAYLINCAQKICFNAIILRYWGQILDELPMVYSSCTFIYSLYMVYQEHLERGVDTNRSFTDTNKRKWKVASLLPLFLLHSFCNSLSLHSKSISLPGTKKNHKMCRGIFLSFVRPCTG